MRIIDGQIFQHLGYVLYWHAMITSGGYKLREVRQYEGDDKWEKLSDEQLLKDSLSTLLRHVELLGEATNFLDKK
jgi:hypothetical protein